MKIRITLKFSTGAYSFRTAKSAVAHIAKHKIRPDQILFNNEPAPFRDLLELYQLELAERRHNKSQGVI